MSFLEEISRKGQVGKGEPEMTNKNKSRKEETQIDKIQKEGGDYEDEQEETEFQGFDTKGN